MSSRATTKECDVGTSDPTYLTHLKVGAVLHRLPNNTFLYGSQQFTSLREWMVFEYHASIHCSVANSVGTVLRGNTGRCFSVSQSFVEDALAISV